MNPVAQRVWKYKNWSLVGNSTAGITTSLVCPELGVAFDVAQGLPWAFSMKQFLITHSHMDHAAGIPYLISQKALTGQKAPEFYMPPSMVEPLHEIMRIWQRIEGHQYEFQFFGVTTGERYPIKGPFHFKSFPTVHRVPSTGYCVFQESKKLKKQYQNLRGDEIAKLKNQGVEVETVFDEPLMAFTGDTQIEFLDGPEFVRNAQILIMEVTYIDQKKSVQSARDWGHIHLDEFLERLPDLKNERIVLMHLSARYSCSEFRKILEKKLSPEDLERVVVFPRDPDRT